MLLDSVFDGREVEVELTNVPIVCPMIPDRMKKDLNALNWEDFIRRHCDRGILGFSEQESFQLCYIIAYI